MPTARIVDELWGEKPPATAVKTVQVFVSQLRKALGEGVLETQPGGYELRVAPGALDAQRFESLLDQGRRMFTDGDPEQAGELLRQALALWRGPALADFQYEAFARNEIGRLDELRLVALEQRFDADLALGRHAEIVGELEALVRDQPLREGPRALLMLALYRGGRQADALAAYQEARSLLVDELGLDPGQTLQQLEKAILRQDESLELSVAPAASEATPTTAPPPALVETVEGRKIVTMVFCELAAGEDVDPESLRLRTRQFLDQAASVVERHGGRLDRRGGDDAMGLFGVPIVREDDALRAVRAAIELRELGASPESNLELRIGVNSGEVITDGAGQVAGAAVAAGRRLAHDAAVGEIAVGEATYAAVAHAVEVVRHKTGLIVLDSVDPDAAAVSRRDDSRFVGRERELERLRDLYQAAAAGSGTRLVTIVGEPGIGKSRLGREFLAGLEPTPRVLVGRCPPYGEGITFLPLRELFRQVGHDESELERPSHEVFATARLVLAELAERQPAIVVFDDAHWAEPTFLDLIEYLAARLGAARILILCNTRPQLLDLRPAWFQPPAESIHLEPLSAHDSERMLESLGAPAPVRSRIAATAEGNPLFAEQLFAMTDELAPTAAMPVTIRGVLHERLDRLDRSERSVLERAAVIGRDFTERALLELAPPDDRARAHGDLFSLVHKRFVRPDPLALDDGYCFQHALIRDAVYDAMPKGLRASIHEERARRLEEQGLEEALVGYHLEHSFLLRRELGIEDLELGARAGRHLFEAGREAFARSDVPATLAYYERARVVLSDDDRTQASLLTELGYARIKRGDVAGAEADLEDAITVAERLGDRRIELRALVERQFVRSVAATGPTAAESVRVAEEVIPELQQLDEPLALARAWWLKSEGDVFACRWRERASALEQALAYAHRGQAGLDIAGTLSSLLAQALAYGPMPVGDALARVRQLMIDAGADRALRASLSTSLAWLLAMEGAFDDARATYAEAVATYDELGLPLRRAVHAQYGAQIEFLAGDPAAAAAELREACDALTSFGARGVAATLEAQLAGVLCSLARWDEADELAQAVAVSAPEDDLMPQLLWRTTVGRVLVVHGEVEKAEKVMAEALRLGEGLESPDLRVALLAAAAEVEAASGRVERARALRDDARSVMVAKGNVITARRLETELVRPPQ